ncbi:MAG: HAD hydrolase-like protein [Candidatus Pacearchaeota archaeon]
MKEIFEEDKIFWRYGDIISVYAPFKKRIFYHFKTGEVSEAKQYLKKEKEIVRSTPPKDRKIETFFIILTKNCNFRCKYCFVNKAKETLSQDKIDELISIMEGFDTKKNCKIFIYGGEPLLYPHLVKKIITKIRNGKKFKNCNITICTNGSLYSDHLADFLKEKKVYLSISLDGDRLLNQMRIDKKNNETYNLVVKNIKKFKAKQIPFTISCTISEKNVDYLPQIPLFFKEQFGINSMGFNFPVGDANFDIDKLAYNLFKSFEVCSKLGVHEDFILRRLYPFLKGEIFDKECNAYGNQIVIQPNLRLHTCVVQSCAGSSKELCDYSDLKCIRNLLKKWSLRTSLKMASCKRCIFKYMCGGGCAYNGLIKRKNLFLPDEQHCRFTYNFVKYFVKRMLNKKIKLVIMDYDGTIVVRNVSKALKAAASVLSRKRQDCVMKLFEERIKGFFDPQKIVTSVGNQLKVSKKRIVKAIEAYFKVFDRGTVLKETRRLLKYLREKYPRIIIFSVNQKDFVLEELKRLKLLNFFDKIYCVKAEEKNSLDSYYKIALTEKIQPYNVLYIGDSFEEIKFAEEIGMKTIWVKLKGGIHPTKWIEKLI